MPVTRGQKKRQEINMENDAAKTLINISAMPIYISRRNKSEVEEELNKAKGQLRKLKLLKAYKSVKQSLEKTQLEMQNILDEVDKEINDLISEIY